MAKQSNMLLSLQKKFEQKMCDNINVNTQMCMDIALIALNEEFGFSAERLKRFAEKFGEIFTDYNNAVNTDWDSDHDLEYSQELLDRRLKAICGKYFVPYMERYEAAITGKVPKRKENKNG